MSRMVVALCGNALSTLVEQREAVKNTARSIVDLIGNGYEIILAHGNGPQVVVGNCVRHWLLDRSLICYRKVWS